MDKEDEMFNAIENAEADRLKTENQKLQDFINSPRFAGGGHGAGEYWDEETKRWKK